MKAARVLVCVAGLLATVAAAKPIETSEYLRVLEATLPAVAEFQLLKAEAERLGLRLWLFGGTAAALAHYARDKQRFQDGDVTYQAERLDDDFTQIFRSTQDLDVVVDDLVPTDDATHLEKLRRLEALIADRPGLRYFMGGKGAWEVRSLRRTNGSKVALLGNPDYSRQHLDSHSTGLIELTDPPLDGRRVRDVQAWDDPAPPFLQDVLHRKLHYYWSRTHGTTSRAAEGKNPPLFSVVRFLTKAFQYELDVDAEAWRKLAEEIARFDAKRDLTTDYARDWIERNGKKLYLHASDLRYARRRLDELGLRSVLENLRGDRDHVGSLAWWMDKSPLPELPILEDGPGETAESLELTVVAHETRTFADYESICRSRRGIPNVFQSRRADGERPTGYAGESASQGNGFYTMRGEIGGRGTGITVRFRVHPKARRGRDFTLVGNEVVFHNRAVLTVIPESLAVGPLEFLALLENRAFFAANDKGVVEKLRRRAAHRLELSDDPDLRSAFYARGEALLAKIDDRHAALALAEWCQIASDADRRKLLASPMGREKYDELMGIEPFARYWFRDSPGRTTRGLNFVLDQPVDERPWATVLTLVRHGDREELRAALAAGPVDRHLAFVAMLYNLTSEPFVRQLVDELARRFRGLPEEEKDALAPLFRGFASHNLNNTRWGGMIRLWTKLHPEWPDAVRRLASTGWLDEMKKGYAFGKGVKAQDFGIELRKETAPVFATLRAAGVGAAVAYEIVSKATEDGAELAFHGFDPRVAAATTPEEVYEAVYASASTGALAGRLGTSAGRRLVALGAPASAYRAVASIPWQSREDQIAVAFLGATEGLAGGPWIDIFDPAPARTDSSRYPLEQALLRALLSGPRALLNSVGRDRLDRVLRDYDDRALGGAERRLRAEPLGPITAQSYLRRWEPWPPAVYFGEDDLRRTIRGGLEAFFATSPSFEEVLALVRRTEFESNEKNTLPSAVRRRALLLARGPSDYVRLFCASEKRPLTMADLAVLKESFPAFLASGAGPEDVKALERAVQWSRFDYRRCFVELYEAAWAKFATEPGKRARLAVPWPRPEKPGPEDPRSGGSDFVSRRLDELLRSGLRYDDAAALRGWLADVPGAVADFDGRFAQLFPEPEHALAVLERLPPSGARAFAPSQWETFLRANPDDTLLRRYLGASAGAGRTLLRTLPAERRRRLQGFFARAADWACARWLRSGG